MIKSNNVQVLKDRVGMTRATIVFYGDNIQVVYTPDHKTRVYYKGQLFTLARFNREIAYISKGNIKLKETETVKFAIFNVISQGITLDDFNRIAESIRGKCAGFDFDAAYKKALTYFKNGKFWGCPGATGECIKYCYDAHAQNGYRSKTIKPSRVRNFIFSCSTEFVELMTLYFILRFETDKALSDPGIQLDFRIHEGGELYSQEYADNIIKIAFKVKILYQDRIFPYTYTKSFFYLEKYLNADGIGHTFDKFITVNGSLWNDSSSAARAYVMDHKMSFYTVLEPDQIDELTASGRNDVYLCECRDCGACGQCRAAGAKVVKKHGHAE